MELAQNTKTTNVELETEKTAPNLIPRGSKVMLPHGGLPEVFSAYLADLIAKTGGARGPIGLQFVSRPEEEKKFYQKKSSDPLIEDENEVAPGVVYKYRGKINRRGQVMTYGRILWTVTRFCGTYCRFCTRGREVGLPPSLYGNKRSAISQSPFLTDDQISQVFKFLINHREINEVILSGGDPLTAPQNYLTKIIEGLIRLQISEDLQIIRLGTRLPIHNPASIRDWHYDLLAKIKNPYLMVHINHPFELTEQTLAVLANFRSRSGALVQGQSVLLKGVNDNAQTLHDLFVKMTAEGIRPYYLYQNDPVYWAAHFTVPFKRAVKIWQSLRPRLSGLAATARFCIDTPFGFGKIPLPEGNAWEFNPKSFKDFKGKKHRIEK